ncbi:hypothetical protein BMT72_20845 [Escherichia coli]|nr:hypothetical protein BMT75_20945 [Escherichia coli]OOJ45247.1 hypothetical protein BMT72_20845 [Escherichia coli]
MAGSGLLEFKEFSCVKMKLPKLVGELQICNSAMKLNNRTACKFISVYCSMYCSMYCNIVILVEIMLYFSSYIIHILTSLTHVTQA